MAQIEPTVVAFDNTATQSFFTDREVAEILGMRLEWVRAHADEIPGFKRLGAYYRFQRNSIQHWLGSLTSLLAAEAVAELLRIPKSWVYANADQIPGVLRLGRYVRFRPDVIRKFLSGSEACQ